MAIESSVKKSIREIIEDSLPTEEEFRVIHIQRYLEAKKNKTCISYWYPKIKEALPQIRMPKTEIVFSNPYDRMELFDGLTPSSHYNNVIERMENLADKMGYPCFIKDSLYSGKHSWKNTCYIEKREDIRSHVYNISENAAIVGVRDLALYFVVRELIPTKPAFFAFHGLMPITCERRYFFRDGKVWFHHPYWPPFSIEKPSCSDWESKLNDLNMELPEEVEYLTQMSNLVGNLLGDGWSIDWLKDASGNWWLTDMAEDYKSFIWKEYAIPNF